MAESAADTKRLYPAGAVAVPAHAEKVLLDRRRRRRRCCCVCLAITGGVVLLLGVVLLVLFLTVLRVRDPTTSLVSAKLSGVAPRVTVPAVTIELNVSLALVVNVHNPNYASFAHAAGHTDLSYRDAHVGDAVVEPGRVPSHGDAPVNLLLTVEADKLLSRMADLIADVVAGEIALDTSTRIPGRVTIFGLFKRHAVAYSDCHLVVGIPNFKIRSQECQDRTAL